ncbi:hypothetical protein ACH4E7_21005 [Kitasatospora sp. NPDC018058]
MPQAVGTTGGRRWSPTLELSEQARGPVAELRAFGAGADGRVGLSTAH